jgi:hypothetical protein
MNKSKLVFSAASAVLIALATPGLAKADPEMDAFLVGHWLGQALGDGGGCGIAQGEFQFVSDGTYVYRAEYEYPGCTGYAVKGHYSATNNWIQLSTEECNPPGQMCGTPLDGAFQVVNQNQILLGGRSAYTRA